MNQLITNAVPKKKIATRNTVSDDSTNPILNGRVSLSSAPIKNDESVAICSAAEGPPCSIPTIASLSGFANTAGSLTALAILQYSDNCVVVGIC